MLDVQKSNRGRTKTLTNYPGIQFHIYFLNHINYNEFTCNMLTSSSSSVIHSSYHTLFGKLRNCSRFIIYHVLMEIPPTDEAKHSNSFH